METLSREKYDEISLEESPDKKEPGEHPVSFPGLLRIVNVGLKGSFSQSRAFANLPPARHVAEPNQIITLRPPEHVVN